MVNNWANRARARRRRRGGHLRCELAVVDDEEKGALAIAGVADGLSESVCGCTRVRQPFPSAALIYFLYYIIILLKLSHVTLFLFLAIPSVFFFAPIHPPWSR